MLQKVTFVSTRSSTEPLKEVVLEYSQYLDRILFNGVPLKLRRSQHQILEYLVLRAERYVTVEDLLDHFYRESLDPPQENSICVFICQLRKELDRHGFGNHLGNQHGRGYLFYLRGAKVLIKKRAHNAHPLYPVPATVPNHCPADAVGEVTPAV